jgi:urease gamma subunit
MKGSDVRRGLKDRNLDPKLVEAIALVAEDVSMVRRDIKELANILNAMQDIVISMTEVQGAMTKHFKPDSVKSEPLDG